MADPGTLIGTTLGHPLVIWTARIAVVLVGAMLAGLAVLWLMRVACHLKHWRKFFQSPPAPLRSIKVGGVGVDLVDEGQTRAIEAIVGQVETHKALLIQVEGRLAMLEEHPKGLLQSGHHDGHGLPNKATVRTVDTEVGRESEAAVDGEV